MASVARHFIHGLSTGTQRGRRLVVSVTEAAELLGISRGLTYKLARASQLPWPRLGRRLVVPRVALLAWLERARPRGGPGRAKGAVVTSARFYHLAEMVFEAAAYVADHDRGAMERLLEAGTLLRVIGGREEAAED